MRLYLIPNSQNTVDLVDEACNASFVNDDGFIIYHVETPHRRGRLQLPGSCRTTTIYRSDTAAQVLGPSSSLTHTSQPNPATPSRSWPRTSTSTQTRRDEDSASVEFPESDFIPPPSYQNAVSSSEYCDSELATGPALPLGSYCWSDRIVEIEYHRFQPTHFRYGKRVCIEHDIFEENPLDFLKYSTRQVTN